MATPTQTPPLDIMIDEPNPFGTLESWEQYLTHLRSLPANMPLGRDYIDDAERMIAWKRANPSS